MTSTTLYQDAKRSPLKGNLTDDCNRTAGVPTGGPISWLTAIENILKAETKSDIPLGVFGEGKSSGVTLGEAVAGKTDIEPAIGASKDSQVELVYLAPLNVTFDLNVESSFGRVECAYFAPMLLNFVPTFPIVQARGRWTYEPEEISKNQVWDLCGLQFPSPARLVLADVETQPKGLLVDKPEPSGAPPSLEPVPAMRAIADVTAAIRALLPEFSEKDLGKLVGVSRQAWRGWAKGETMPRSTKRRHLYGLRRLLELRHSLAPHTSLAEWLESPLSRRDQRTPAELLEQGRQSYVAALAASLPTPGGDDFETEPLDFGPDLDLTEGQKVLAEDREIGQSEPLG
jgi:hypothetical protein